MNIKIKTLVMITISYCFSMAAFAADSYIYDDQKINGRLEFGLLNGYAKEYAYDNNRKISQLDWEIKNVLIIKYGISYEAHRRITLGGHAWINLGRGRAYMDDYDWLDAKNPNKLTDHSWHRHTKLTRAYEADLNVTGWLLADSNYKLGPIVGYSTSKYSFVAKGGRYWYNSGAQQGSEPSNRKGISYSQQIDVPYIGLVSKNAIYDFEIKAMVKYSPFARAKAIDNHHLRSAEFTEKYRKLKYLSLSLDTDYHINQLVSVNFGVTHLRIKEKSSSRGEMYNYKTDISYPADGEGGMAHKNTMFRIGLNMSF